MKFFTSSLFMTLALVGIIVNTIWQGGDLVLFWIGILIYSSVHYLAKVIVTRRIDD